MNRPKTSTIVFCAFLFLFFFVLLFPYEDLRGYIFSTIQKNTGIQLYSDDLSLTFLGWPGIKLRKVDVTVPLGFSDLELSCERATARVGLSGLFPPAPGFSLFIKGLKKGGDAFVDISRTSSAIIADIESTEVNLEQFDLGMSEPIQGLLTMKGSVRYDTQELAKMAGGLTLNIKKLRLPAQNMEGLVFPAVPFGDVSSKIVIKNGTIEISNFKFGSDKSDFRGSITGDIRLGRDWPSSFLKLVLRINLSEKYRQDPQSATLVSFLTGYQNAPGEYAAKWSATIRDLSTNTFALLPQKADP